MAASGKGLGWGSFLSQAVAGVESRLDNMLAETEDEHGTSTPSPAAPGPITNPASPLPALPAISDSITTRASSSNRANVNDRLQARLAKAMAGKVLSASGDNKSTASPRSSIDLPGRSSPEGRSTSKDQGYGSESSLVVGLSGEPNKPEKVSHSATSPMPAVQSDLRIGESVKQQLADGETAVASGEEIAKSALPKKPAASGENQGLSQNTVDHANTSDLVPQSEELKARQQQEVQEYVEEIDSLQSKLQYLSKTMADAAKKSAASAPSGSLERKLAEKDERIALLMEEGQKLSTSEHKYRTMIKKLRQQMMDRDRNLDELKQAQDRATSDVESLRARLLSSQETEKQEQETQRATAAFQNEIDALKRELIRRDDEIHQLKQDHRAKLVQVERVAADSHSKRLATEEAKQKALEDANNMLRTEKESLTDKARRDNIEWTEKLDRVVNRGCEVENELRAELRAMEGKLEAMRAVAEESSSGSGGEAQIKLFRQIETLQSQYTSASDNWQGIESSLLVKVASLEKEKDEAQRRESDMRKKARNSTSRCRSLEEELQDAKADLTTAQQTLDSCRVELAALRISSKATETALEQTRNDLDKERHSVSRDFTVEAERRRWVDDVVGATSRTQSRPDSPLLSVPRTFSSDLLGLSLSGRPRRTPTPGSIPDGAEGLSNGRRPSFQPPFRSSTLSTSGSAPPPAPYSPFEPPSDLPLLAPPISSFERENGVEDMAPSPPRNVAHDMISVSTVAAGPSVQLVERMSAAIRRLEGEKVAAKEELARVCNQRDEARGDMLSLMKEVEEAKTVSLRVPKLEAEVASLDARYQTTLEMLGEKSELVEELKADVEDVKAMYRELVERTIK